MVIKSIPKSYKPIPSFPETRKIRGMNAKAVLENGAKYEWIEFDSLKEASEYSGIPVGYISKVINSEERYSTRGWIFEEVTNV